LEGASHADAFLGQGNDRAGTVDLGKRGREVKDLGALEERFVIGSLLCVILEDCLLVRPPGGRAFLLTDGPA